MPLAPPDSKQLQMAFENESKTFFTNENLKCRVKFLKLNTLYIEG